MIRFGKILRLPTKIYIYIYLKKKPRPITESNVYYAARAGRTLMHQHRKITSLVINKHLALTTLVTTDVIIFFFFCLFVCFLSDERDKGSGEGERQFPSSSPTTSFIFPGENMAYRHVKRAELRLREVVNLPVEVKLRKYGKGAQK